MVTSYYIMKMTKNKFQSNISEWYKSKDNSYVQTEKNYKCRVCLNKANVPIYSSENIDIVEALRLFGDIHINEYDDYPKHLCNACYKFLKGAILFRETAKRSEKILQQPIKVENVQFQGSYNNKLDKIIRAEKISKDDVTQFRKVKLKIIQQPKKVKIKPKLQGSCDNNMDETIQPLKFSNDLTQHIKKDNIQKKRKSKISPKIACHICSSIITLNYYKNHLTMHDPNHKRHVCDVCGKTFRLRDALYTHRLSHRTDFPYKCKLCPYSAKYTGLLRSHLQTHTKDYKYMCTECPARFVFNTNLHKHMLKHKEPQFKCIKCSRLFFTKHDLNRHIKRVHLRLRDFICSLCGKGFVYLTTLRKHEISVHKREKTAEEQIPEDKINIGE